MAHKEPLDNNQRHTHWKLVVSQGSGRNRRRIVRRFEGNARQADAALRELERNARFVGASDSFAGFANTWNDARLAAGTISKSTHTKYYWHIHVIAPLLPDQLKNITPTSILTAYSTLKSVQGRQWSNTTLRSAHNSLKRIFRAAVHDGVLSTSPMEGVDAPAPDTKPKKALSPAQAAAVLDALPLTSQGVAVSLMLRCGLRRSEVVGIKWNDIQDGVLHVPRAITKSDSGMRDIPLDDETMKLLTTRAKIVDNLLGRVGAHLSANDTICCNDDGRPLTVSGLRNWWYRHRGEYGLQDYTLHELRHTFLTNLAQAGVHPSVMQRLAGHANISTTMQIYTHVQHDDLKQAMNALSQQRTGTTTGTAFPSIKNGQTQKRA